MRRRIVFTSVLCCTLLLLAGCGNLFKATSEKDASTSDKEEVKEKKEDDKKESSSIGDYNIVFSGDVKEEDDQFIIEGKSNLIPGSRLVGEVVVDEGETVFSDTTEIVEEDGSFYMELAHHQYGEAEVVVRFDFDSVQEDEVKRHYGEKGQKLEGPFIYKHETYDGILKKAEVKIAFEPGASNLTLTAPDWDDLPEDYGDPRVWIEVEDITEDGEFFYLHGKSNILEGSEVNVDYQYNRAKTSVKPDGSFDFKFDYEYLEDEEIIIVFEPSAYQWNEIEEAYGSSGQKLVGNLVVSDKYNNEKQFVEKRIPWDNKSGQDDSAGSTKKDDSEEEDTKDNDPNEEKDVETEEDQE